MSAKSLCRLDAPSTHNYDYKSECSNSILALPLCLLANCGVPVIPGPTGTGPEEPGGDREAAPGPDEVHGGEGQRDSQLQQQAVWPADTT